MAGNDQDISINDFDGMQKTLNELTGIQQQIDDHIKDGGVKILDAVKTAGSKGTVTDGAAGSQVAPAFESTYSALSTMLSSAGSNAKAGSSALGTIISNLQSTLDGHRTVQDETAAKITKA